MCMHYGAGTVQKSQGTLQELTLIFYHVDLGIYSGGGAQVIRFGGKHLYVLSRLMDPRSLNVPTITASVLTKSSELVFLILIL